MIFLLILLFCFNKIGSQFYEVIIYILFTKLILLFFFGHGSKYGVVLEDLGFSKFFDSLLDYIRPCAILLYGDINRTLDHHHCFIVQYKLGEDVDLGFHYVITIM